MKAKRQELKAEWDANIGLRLRYFAQAEAEYARDKARHEERLARADEAPAPKRARLTPGETLWQAGAHDSPCSEATLLEAVSKHHKPIDANTYSNPDALQRGVLATGEQLINKEKASFFKTDPRRPNWLPPIDRMSQCHQCHPMFCAVASVLWWPMVLQISKTLNSIMSWYGRWETIGQVLDLSIDDPEDPESRISTRAMISEVRYSRPVMQVLIPLDGDGSLIEHHSIFVAWSSYYFLLNAAKQWCDGNPALTDSIGMVSLSFMRRVYLPLQSIKHSVLEDLPRSDKSIMRGESLAVWPEPFKIGRKKRKSDNTDSMPDKALKEPEDKILDALIKAKSLKQAQKDTFRRLFRQIAGPRSRKRGKGKGKGGPGGAGAAGNRGKRGKGHSKGDEEDSKSDEGGDDPPDGGRASAEDAGAVSDATEDDDLPGDGDAGSDGYNEWEHSDEEDGPADGDEGVQGAEKGGNGGVAGGAGKAAGRGKGVDDEAPPPPEPGDGPPPPEPGDGPPPPAPGHGDAGEAGKGHGRGRGRC